MSETPISPEQSPSRYLSEEKLVDVHGIVDRFVLDDDKRTDLGTSILSTRRKISDNVEEIVSVQWYKNLEEKNLPEQVHAVITATVGPEGQVAQWTSI